MSIGEKGIHCLFMFVGWVSVCFIAGTALFIIALSWIPTSWWFVYYDIRPTEVEILIGGPTIYDVDFEVKRISDMVYHDSIMCDIVGNEDPEDYVKVFTRKSANPRHPITERTTRQFVIYFVPDREMDCYLHSDIVAEQKFAMKKHQDVDPRYTYRYVWRKNANPDS